MIVADTSALIEIILDEPERDRFTASIAAAERVGISVATVVETRLVLHRRGGAKLTKAIDLLLASNRFEVVPVDADQADIAHAAFVTYGKGTGHPAGLNFGDLFSYALAKARGVPLLFKGDDFARTDIAAAVG
jgi:ribonuclease VapC